MTSLFNLSYLFKIPIGRPEEQRKGNREREKGGKGAYWGKNGTNYVICIYEYATMDPSIMCDYHALIKTKWAFSKSSHILMHWRLEIQHEFKIQLITLSEDIMYLHPLIGAKGENKDKYKLTMCFPTWQLDCKDEDGTE